MAGRNLTAKELADRWGIGVSALAMQRRQSRGPAWRKVRNRVIYDLGAVLAYEADRPAIEQLPGFEASDRLIKVDEVCSLLSVSKPTVYRMIRKSGFPAGIVLSEKATRWSRKAVLSWIAGRAGAAAG